MDAAGGALEPEGSWLERLLAGTWVIQRRVSTRDRLCFDLEARESTAALTRQERRVVAEVARCASHAEIGFDLGIGVSTVATHLGTALRKLRVDRTDLPLLAVAVSRDTDPAVRRARLISPRVEASWFPELTAAEREVAQIALLGASNAAIAAARASSIRTVANQLASILRKLGAQSRLGIVREVVRRAYEQQLVVLAS